MKFDEWYDKNRATGRHISMDDAKKGWIACKEEVLKIIDTFHNTPAYQYIKEKIESDS